jgi:HK97 family phage major capsid protein
MNKIEKMKVKREDLRLQAVAVLTKAENEDRFLTDDENKPVQALHTDITKWDESIKRAEDTAAITETRLAETDEDDDVPKRTPTRVSPSSGDEKRFKSFGEQLMAVYRSSAAGARVDERLVTRGQSGANETDPSAGGFLVQPDFVSELLKKTYDTGILAGKVRRVPISANSNSLRINAIDDDSRKDGCRWGGVQTYWADEADALTASKPKFRQIDLQLKKLTGLCYATDELLADAAALESVIRQAFTDEFAFKIDDAILHGNGAGQPLGILKSNAVVKQELEAAQTAKITVENLVKMWSRLWSRSRANAVWYINQQIEPLLYTLQVGDRPVYIPAGGLSESPYATLFGRPVVPLEQCAELGEAGDILLADLSQYLLIDKGGINAASSIHVRFLNDENVFRFIYRVDGQPIWNKPITPYKGSAALSPFIALAKRN